MVRSAKSLCVATFRRDPPIRTASWSFSRWADRFQMQKKNLPQRRGRIDYIRKHSKHENARLNTISRPEYDLKGNMMLWLEGNRVWSSSFGVWEGKLKCGQTRPLWKDETKNSNHTQQQRRRNTTSQETKLRWRQGGSLLWRGLWTQGTCPSWTWSGFHAPAKRDPHCTKEMRWEILEKLDK